MERGKYKVKEEKPSPLATNSPSDVLNGNANQENSSLNQQMHLGIAHFSPLGLQTGKKTAGGSISEATGPRSPTHDSGKQKAQQSPNNTNGPKGQSRESDHLVPIANVVRIMRKGLPDHAKVADEAKETMQQCVSEFIGFLTSDANEACKKEHRKTITADDLLGAMSRLGFDHFVEPLMMYLQKYRESEMLPRITRSHVPYGANAAPSYGPPIFAMPTVVHPQHAMGQDSVSALNGVYYPDGSGQASGAGKMSQESGSAANVQKGNGLYLGLGIRVGPSGDDGGGGSSGSSQNKAGFHDSVVKYE